MLRELVDTVDKVDTAAEGHGRGLAGRPACRPVQAVCTRLSYGGREC